MSTLKDQFNKHLSALRKTCREKCFLSFHYHILESPDFKKIVELGKDEKTSNEVITLLFQDLRMRETWEIIYALGIILNYQPKPDEVNTSGSFQIQSLRNLVKGLLSQGKKLGYL